jgi:hypothetical protein
LSVRFGAKAKVEQHALKNTKAVPKRYNYGFETMHLAAAGMLALIRLFSKHQIQMFR